MPAYRVIDEPEPNPDVVSIDLARGTAIMDTGEICAVAGIYDGEGVEIDLLDADELGAGEGAFVIGPTRTGHWVSGTFAGLAEKRRWQ